MGRSGKGRAADDLIGDLTKNGVTTAHVGIFDLDGALRERRLALTDLAPYLDGGGTFVNVLHQWDTAESVHGSGPFVGEAIAIDPASARRYPFEPDAALLIADFTGPSGALSPRNLLRGLVERAAAAGYAVRCSLEFEFIVLDETAESIRAKGYDDLTPFAPDNRCWAGQSAAIYSDFVRELQELLEAADIGLYGLGLELGPGCFEATLGASDPLKAADDAALFKTFTKAFCRQRGLTASFMAQLSADYPGLGGHVHLSLADAKTAKGVFHDGGDGQRMSPTMRSFIAGLIELAPDSLALCCHTVNAYRRLTPGNWAPRTATWAVQDYSVAVRAVPEPQDVARLEFRLPAADTNPFLALAMVLGAGLYGIEKKTALPPAVEGHGPGSDPEGAPALPHDLLEAADRLDKCAAAREIFGNPFIDHFVATRRHEEAALRKHVSAFERARYIEAV